MSAQVRHTCQTLIAIVNHDHSQRNSNWGRRLVLTPAPRSPLPLPPSPFLPPLFGGNIQQVSPRASPLLPFLFRRRKLRERRVSLSACLSARRDIYPCEGRPPGAMCTLQDLFLTSCGMRISFPIFIVLSSPRIDFLSSLISFDLFPYLLFPTHVQSCLLYRLAVILLLDLHICH